MKAKKILTAAVLSLAMLTSVGCGGQTIQSFDKDKTQLYVGVYNGGYGMAWLEKAEKGFEELYPDVDVVLMQKKDEYETAKLKDTIDELGIDLYYAPISYLQMLEEDFALDITDAVTGAIDLNGVKDTSIESRMLPDFKNYYNMGTESAPAYYAVPLGGSFWGLNYDYDLFEEESLFIAESDGSGDNITWTSGLAGQPEKSLGRDGVKGTYDDGCPETYEDFYALMLKMAQKSVTPFIWANKQNGYHSYFMQSLMSDYEGKSVIDAAYAMDGVEITLFDTAKSTYDEAMASADRKEVITDKTGYYLSQMKGKAVAIKLIRDVLDNGWYDTRSDLGTTTFMQAQSFYLESKKYSKINPAYNRVAFLIDGGHWYNEIKAYDKSYTATNYPEYAASGRRFSIMPFPKFETSENDKSTLMISSANFGAFVRKNAEQKELAKKFLQYTLTTENIKMTATESGMSMFYRYELSDAQYSAMPYYYRVASQIMSSDKVDKVSGLAKTTFYKNNVEYTERYNLLWLGTHVLSDGVQVGVSSIISDMQARNLDAYSYMKASERKYTASYWAGQYQLSK